MSIDRRQVMAGAAGLAAVSAAGVAQAKTVPVTVISASSQWSPSMLSIKKGDSVEWTNTAPIPHVVCFDASKAKDAAHVVLPAGVAPFKSPSLKRGDVFTHKFDVKGEYHYCCRLHEDLMMMGTITVS